MKNDGANFKKTRLSFNRPSLFLNSTTRKLFYVVILALPLFQSCAYNKYQVAHNKLDQLSLGMPSSQVVVIMGRPEQIKPLAGGGSAYRYELGGEPYDVTFGAQGKLTGYFRDDEEHYQRQAAWMSAINSVNNQHDPSLSEYSKSINQINQTPVGASPAQVVSNRQPTHCTTRYVGSTAYTDCN